MRWGAKARGAYFRILDLYCLYGCACIACMATVMVRVSEGQKGLWVAAAHDERVSLSEWVRRRCDDGLGAGEVGADTPSVAESGGVPFRASRSSAPAPSSPEPVFGGQSLAARHGFRPDPKVKKSQ